jgi:hypothetical protein
MQRRNTKNSGRESEKKISRRRVLGAGAAGVATLSLPGVASAKANSSSGQEKISIEKEVVRETETYVLIKYNVDGVIVFLKEITNGDGKETVKILDTSDVSDSGSGIRQADTRITTRGWRDHLFRFKREDYETYELCADNSYGAHRWKGATVEFTVPANYLSATVIAAAVDHIIEPLGIPHAGKVLSIIAGYIATLGVRQFTFGALDKDGWLNVKYLSVRASLDYDTPPHQTQQIGMIPGVHQG